MARKRPRGEEPSTEPLSFLSQLKSIHNAMKERAEVQATVVLSDGVGGDDSSPADHFWSVISMSNGRAITSDDLAQLQACVLRSLKGGITRDEIFHGIVSAPEWPQDVLAVVALLHLSLLSPLRDMLTRVPPCSDPSSTIWFTDVSLRTALSTGDSPHTPFILDQLLTAVVGGPPEGEDVPVRLPFLPPPAPPAPPSLRSLAHTLCLSVPPPLLCAALARLPRLQPKHAALAVEGIRRWIRTPGRVGGRRLAVTLSAIRKECDSFTPVMSSIRALLGNDAFVSALLAACCHQEEEMREMEEELSFPALRAAVSSIDTSHSSQHALMTGLTASLLSSLLSPSSLPVSPGSSRILRCVQFVCCDAVVTPATKSRFWRALVQLPRTSPRLSYTSWLRSVFGEGWAQGGDGKSNQQNPHPPHLLLPLVVQLFSATLPVDPAHVIQAHLDTMRNHRVLHREVVSPFIQLASARLSDLQAMLVDSSGHDPDAVHMVFTAMSELGPKGIPPSIKQKLMFSPAWFTTSGLPLLMSRDRIRARVLPELKSVLIAGGGERLAKAVGTESDVAETAAGLSRRQTIVRLLLDAKSIPPALRESANAFLSVSVAPSSSPQSKDIPVVDMTADDSRLTSSSDSESDDVMGVCEGSSPKLLRALSSLGALTGAADSADTADLLTELSHAYARDAKLLCLDAKARHACASSLVWTLIKHFPCEEMPALPTWFMLLLHWTSHRLELAESVLAIATDRLSRSDLTSVKVLPTAVVVLTRTCVVLSALLSYGDKATVRAIGSACGCHLGLLECFRDVIHGTLPYLETSTSDIAFADVCSVIELLLVPGPLAGAPELFAWLKSFALLCSSTTQVLTSVSSTVCRVFAALSSNVSGLDALALCYDAFLAVHSECCLPVIPPLMQSIVSRTIITCGSTATSCLPGSGIVWALSYAHGRLAGGSNQLLLDADGLSPSDLPLLLRWLLHSGVMCVPLLPESSLPTDQTAWTHMLSSVAGPVVSQLHAAVGADACLATVQCDIAPMLAVLSSHCLPSPLSAHSITRTLTALCPALLISELREGSCSEDVGALHLVLIECMNPDTLTLPPAVQVALSLAAGVAASSSVDVLAIVVMSAALFLLPASSPECVAVQLVLLIRSLNEFRSPGLTPRALAAALFRAALLYLHDSSEREDDNAHTVSTLLCKHIARGLFDDVDAGAELLALLSPREQGEWHKFVAIVSSETCT